MRFARSAAAGLGVGMLAGFALALVRPRRSSPPTDLAAAPATGVGTGGEQPRLVDATLMDTPAGRDAGSDFSGRVI